MSYATCEDGLLAVLRKVKGYDAKNTSKGDYRVIVRGRNTVVLTPGPFTRERISYGYYRNRWGVQVELYIRSNPDISDVREAIRVERQKLITKLDEYPSLDDTTGVVDALFTEGDEPAIMEGSQTWWRQIMTCYIEERETVQYGS